MRDEYVTFEQAENLKWLGFNLIVPACYHNEEKSRQHRKLFKLSIHHVTAKYKGWCGWNHWKLTGDTRISVPFVVTAIEWLSDRAKSYPHFEYSKFESYKALQQAILAKLLRDESLKQCFGGNT
ncbi:MAG: hypothetical protein LBG21_04105 [Campylobacteraceae bacterium]|jgi:hypothetical protein|nr:hypothetical protein [Campylobacteraceae bacterium]